MTVAIAPQRGGFQTGNIIPKGFKQGQVQNFTPEQMDLFKSLFSQTGQDSFLGKMAGGDQDTFNQMEAPAQRQFAQQQGGLASRFSNMGLGGGKGMNIGSRNSSGFQNTSNQASSDFAQDLQSKRQGMQRQALMDMLGLSENLLGQRPNEQFLVEKQAKKPSFLMQLLSGLAPIAGTAAGGFFGGPAGALAGGSIGGAFGSALNR